MSASAGKPAGELRRDLAGAASGRAGGGEPFRLHRGRVAPLRRSHVDTDQIIPKNFLKRIERTGFGPFLFHDWRRAANGDLDPAFPLNQPAFAGATILAAGPNFGCGSSREHAAWALTDAGFRVVLAPSFADIFRNNAVGNGLVPVAIAEAAVNTILDRADAGTGYELTIDLERCEVRDAHGLTEHFAFDEASRQRLLDGKDEIDLILAHDSDISAFEQRRTDSLA
jgi:3-isopropylmalate/(R)-2-methylmalate dehydratase small subunit